MQMIEENQNYTFKEENNEFTFGNNENFRNPKLQSSALQHSENNSINFTSVRKINLNKLTKAGLSEVKEELEKSPGNFNFSSFKKTSHKYEDINESKNFSDNRNKDSKSVSNTNQKNPNGLVSLKFIMSHPVSCEFSILVNVKNKVSDLLEVIQSKVKELHPQTFENMTLSDIRIFSNYGRIAEGQEIESNKHLNDREPLFLFIFNQRQDDLSLEEEKDYRTEADNTSHNKTELSSVEKNSISNITALDQIYPTCRKYKTEPALGEIEAWSIDRLNKVENFCIFNDHGKIEFNEEVDLTYMNLDDIVKIEPCIVEVYPGSAHDRGTKINKKATVYLYNLGDEDQQISPSEEFIQSLKNVIEQKSGTRFISYCRGELIFDVDYFK